MTLFRAGALLCLFTLSACGGGQSTSPNAASAPNQNPKARLSGKVPDIVDDTNNLALGNNWYRYETFNGQTFRWVNNDAQLIVKDPSSNEKGVAFLLEAGPSLGTKNFVLHVRSGARNVANASVTGHQWVNVILPVRPHTSNVFTLHVDGGGKPVSSDNRILNFRVFTVANADIVEPGSGITLGSNWDVAERFAGQTFRWVNNDANFTVTSNHSANERIDISALPGPGLGSRPLAIDLRKQSGQMLGAIHLDAHGNGTFTVAVKPGANALVLHVSGGGQAAKGDTRILNFRVFLLAPVH